MKTLKRSILYMTKQYIKARDTMMCVYNTPKEREYIDLGESDAYFAFYFDDEDRVVGMFKNENNIETNYEWSGR